MAESRGWPAWREQRHAYAGDLARVVADGVRRRDTDHPVFCGCIDWHSSVHGAYALLVATRLTGDTEWAGVVDAVLTGHGLAAELDCVKGGHLDHERPYGFAWFLKLAQERERVSGKDDLRPLATEIAQRLDAWIRALTPEEVMRRTARCEYGNLSWALLNLWEWHGWCGETGLRADLEAYVWERVAPLDGLMHPSDEERPDEFFSASLQRIRTVLTVVPPERSLSWFRRTYPDGVAVTPVCHVPRPHVGGINFSRSWALWTLFQTTGEERYRDQYVEHVTAHMARPEWWRDDYRKYAHWVPQFGVYALALSVDADEPPSC